MFPVGFERKRVATRGAEINLVQGGNGPPVLLLHGYPQTHVMWHAVASRLAPAFRLVCADLRGYGDSAKPPSAPDHAPYAKRTMAADMVEVMTTLGHERFCVVGHDRGARVAHRLALDHPARLTRACLMDIVPTLHAFGHTDQAFATGYYHWFFLIQPDRLPERLIGADPEYFLRQTLARWGGPDARFDPDAVNEYLRCFGDPATLHATCEDYRAAATIDLVHDGQDRGRRLDCPLLVLWGARGFVARSYDVLAVWRDYARDVHGKALDCGHFLPEEAPQEVADALLDFFRT